MEATTPSWDRIGCRKLQRPGVTLALHENAGARGPGGAVLSGSICVYCTRAHPKWRPGTRPRTLQGLASRCRWTGFPQRHRTRAAEARVGEPPCGEDSPRSEVVTDGLEGPARWDHHAERRRRRRAMRLHGEDGTGEQHRGEAQHREGECRLGHVFDCGGGEQAEAEGPRPSRAAGRRLSRRRWIVGDLGRRSKRRSTPRVVATTSSQERDQDGDL